MIAQLQQPRVALSWAVAAIFVLSACGDDEPKRRKTRGNPGSMSANLKDLGKPSVEIAEDKKKKRKGRKKRKRRRGSAIGPMPKDDPFTDSDFIANEQDSRDPFRNYLLVTQVATADPELSATDKRYLANYSVDELKITGIVGSRRKFAMMLDPRTGRTTIMGRRDRYGKEGALIFRVNRDHLVLLIPKKLPGGKTKNIVVKRYVDDGRKIIDIPNDPLNPDEGGIRRYSWRSRRRSRRKER